MANLKVVLQRYVKTKDWHRVRVEPVKSGRGFTKDWDNPKTYGSDCTALGPYGLKWYVGGRAQYSRVGDDLREAITAQENKQTLLSAQNAAEKAGATLVTEAPDRETLAQQKVAFIRLKELSNRDRETITAYENLISEFLTVSGKRYADQIVETDFLEFCNGLRKRGLSERTVTNYFGSVTAFLNFCGIDHKKIVAKEHRPHKIDDDPVAYSEDEVRGFLGALTNERHRLFFEFLLKSGAREKEASHLEWTDLNWADSCVDIPGEKNLTLMVNGQMKKVQFRTKTRRSRSITLESGLMERLKAWKQKNPSTRFVFGTRQDLPDGHMLEICKLTAYKAGLNCKMCQPCLKTKGKECENFYLHRWRHTFATWALQRGIDIRTVQRMLGHTKIEMTAVYLGVSKGQAVRDSVNAAFAGF
jgi:integrase